MAILSFVAVILVYIATNYYIGWHGLFVLRFFDISIAPIVYWSFFYFITISYVVGSIPIAPKILKSIFQPIGGSYFVVYEYLLIMLPIIDLLVWILKKKDIVASVPMLTATVAVIFIALIVRGSWNARTPIVRTYQFEVDKQVNELKEMKILVASDLHLGYTVGNKHLKKLIDQSKEMKPDLILLVGDIIDSDVTPFVSENMSDVLKQLSAPFGVYAVLGNHEYYGGDMDQYLKVMDSIGIPVLQDQKILINNSFYVAGRKDKTAESREGRLSMDQLLSNVDKSLPLIVMDHQPYHLDKAEQAGVDILLSGHTHRGQFAPNHLVTKMLYEIDWGYLLKGKMNVVVSSGFGTWGPPIRLASQSEIVQLIVKFRP